jgi:putative hydrolase of the HAD superfamily
MIEAAIQITDYSISAKDLEIIIGYGKDLLNKPVTVLEGVEEVLTALKGKYRLVMATKGDLLDQERKLKKSGLQHYFHHIEIMSEKKEEDYKKLIRHLDIKPSEFVMIGNSIKSDVLPVLAIGAYAIHIPYHTTWAHERVDVKVYHSNFREVKRIAEILEHY